MTSLIPPRRRVVVVATAFRRTLPRVMSNAEAVDASPLVVDGLVSLLNRELATSVVVAISTEVADDVIASPVTRSAVLVVVSRAPLFILAGIGS